MNSSLFACRCPRIIMWHLQCQNTRRIMALVPSVKCWHSKFIPPKQLETGRPTSTRTTRAQLCWLGKTRRLWTKESSQCAPSDVEHTMQMSCYSQSKSALLLLKKALLNTASNHCMQCDLNAPTRHARHVASRGGKCSLGDKPNFPQPLCLSQQHKCSQWRTWSSRKWSMPAPSFRVSMVWTSHVIITYELS